MQVTTERFGRRVLRAVTKQKAVVAILVMLIAMIFFKTNFYTSYNLLNVLKDAAVNEIIAFGVTLTVIAAGCDLSVGGVMCLSGIVAIQLMNGGMNMWLAILLAVLSGAVVGFINGFLKKRKPSSLRSAWACSSRAFASSSRTLTRSPARIWST